jgi:hypothetical protein
MFKQQLNINMFMIKQLINMNIRINKRFRVYSKAGRVSETPGALFSPGIDMLLIGRSLLEVAIQNRCNEESMLCNPSNGLLEVVGSRRTWSEQSRQTLFKNHGTCLSLNMISLSVMVSNDLLSPVPCERCKRWECGTQQIQREKGDISWTRDLSVRAVQAMGMWNVTNTKGEGRDLLDKISEREWAS